MDFSTIIIIVACVVLGIGFCLCLAIANYAGESYVDRYNSLSKIQSKSSYSILEFFKFINDKYFDGRIVIIQNKENYTDAYAQGRLFLSPNTINSESLASFSIVAHELGHALQDKTSKKLKRMAHLRAFGHFIGFFLFPFLIAGVILLFFGNTLFYVGIGLLCAGLLIFLLAILLKVITIRIEKEASRNAISFLKEMLPQNEIKVCKKFLNDARLTYWADLFRSLLGWTLLTRKNKLFR